MKHPTWKRICALVLSVMLVMALTACAQTSSSSKTPSSGSPSSTGASSQEEKLYYNKEGLPICDKEITLSMIHINDYTKDSNKTFFINWVRENMGLNIQVTGYSQDAIKTLLIHRMGSK